MPGRRRGRKLVVVLLATYALLVVVAGVSMVLAREPLQEGRALALDARGHVEALELGSAVERLQSAERSFGTARRMLRNPLSMVASHLVPVVGSSARTAGALSHAGELSASAAGDLLSAIEDVPGGLDGLAPSGGRLPVDRIAELAPVLHAVAADLERAHRAVAESPDLLVVGQVREARSDALEVLTPMADGMRSSASVAAALPGFLGLDGPRTYWFGASNPAEIRGSGGFLGAWALLEVDDGVLTLGDFQEIHALENLPRSAPVDAPSEGFADRYDPFGARWRWTTPNVSPDFPSAGQVIVQMFAEAEGDDIDGVVAADPFALEAVLRATGPVEVPAVGRVAADEVVDLVTNEAYVMFEGDQDRRQAVLGTVAAAALGAMFEGGSDRPDAIRALGAAAGDGHLLLYSAHPEEQERFEAAGLAGALGGPPGDFLGLALNSQTNAKVDYYLEVHARTEVVLLPDGRSRGVADVRFRNDAPRSGMPQYVIGPSLPGLAAGDNRFLVDLFCSPSCEPEAFSGDTDPDPLRGGVDRGHPAVGTKVHLASGEEEELAFQWTTADAWWEDRGVLTYRLTTRPPGTIRPMRQTVRVAIPPGMEVIDAPDGARVTSEAVEVDGAWRGPTTLEFVLARPPAERMWSSVREWLGRPLVQLGAEGP